jgi:hypothetical protein
MSSHTKDRPVPVALVAAPCCLQRGPPGVQAPVRGRRESNRRRSRSWEQAVGLIRRLPAPDNKSALVVELTPSGRALARQVQQVWCDLADEVVAGLPAVTAVQLSAVLAAMTGNIEAGRDKAAAPP